MDCCLVDMDTESGPDVFREKIRTARKEHKCSECRQPILPGEKYEHVTGLWEGHWGTFKTCSACMELRDRFFCAGYVFGEVLQDLKDVLNEVDDWDLGMFDELSLGAIGRLEPLLTAE